LSFISPVLPRPAQLRAATASRRSAAALALLYAVLLACANPAAAGGLTPEARAGLEALRAGDMRKLVIHEAPVAAAEVPFTDRDGNETTLAASNGRFRIVNFWATWCAPCRHEMPSLDALQRERGGPDLEVIAIATGRNNPDSIDDFLAEAEITDLATWLDPKSKLAAAMNVPGLPVTVVLDRDGHEIARLLGGADWNSPDAHALIDALLALPAS
jgi:thiol-disulfide isomerase/thioredoxin